MHQSCCWAFPELGHGQRIRHDVRRHARLQRPADDFAVEQVKLFMSPLEQDSRACVAGFPARQRCGVRLSTSAFLSRIEPMKKILGIALLALFATFGCGKKAAEEVPRVEKTGDAAGKAVLNAALQVSEMEVSALAEITDKLKSACARNKYGLSETACIELIDRRKALCLQATAQKYPGQLANVERLQEVVGSHVACLFEQ